MKRFYLGLVVLALPFMVGCAVTEFFQKRVECGIKCPANSSCQVSSSGVFTASFSCLCDHGLTKGGFMHPTKGDTCPPPEPAAWIFVDPLAIVVSR